MGFTRIDKMTIKKEDRNAKKQVAVSSQNQVAKKPLLNKVTSNKTDVTLPPTKKINSVTNRSELSGADAVVKLRMEFFKSGSRKLKWSIFVCLICLFISSVAAFIAISKEGERYFFAADESAQFIELIPLSEPNHKSSVISQWLSDALIDTFDFNYLNMKDVLNVKSQVWFTDSGRNSLITSISEAKSFDVIVKEKLIVQLVLIQSPILVREGIGSTGRYEWILQIPAQFTYTNESAVYTSSVIFTVSVIRRSMLEDVKGLGVNKLIVEFMSK